MKYIKLIVVVTLGFVFTISCTPEDNVAINLEDGVVPGIVVRTLNLTGTVFDFFNVPDSELAVDFEIQAPAGDVVSQVEIFVDFQDNTFFDSEFNTNGTTDVAETLIQTISAAELTVGRFDYPTGSFSFSYQELLDAMGIQNDLDDVFNSDQVVVRLAVTMEDGRVFSNDGTNSPSLEDGFFTSPYRYFSTISCPVVIVGDYTIDFVDSYGDGWNGAEIVVVSDGDESRFTLEDGATGSVTFTVPPGVQNQTVSYSGGAWDEEVSYTITRDSDGRELASFSQSADGPPDGVITLDTGLNPCVRGN